MAQITITRDAAGNVIKITETPGGFWDNETNITYETEA